MEKLSTEEQGYTIFELLSSEDFTEDEKLSIKSEILLRVKEEWMLEPIIVSAVLSVFAYKLVKLIRESMESDNHGRN